MRHNGMKVRHARKILRQPQKAFQLAGALIGRLISTVVP